MKTTIFRNRWKYGNRRRRFSAGKAVTYLASVVLTSSSSTLSAGIEVDAPVYTASGALVGGSSTLSSVGTTDAPDFTASGTLTSQSTTLSASASFATVINLVSIDLVSTPSVLSSVSTFLIFYTAVVDLISTQAVLSVVAETSSVGPAPGIPVLAAVDNGDSTATLTVSASSSGAANAIYILGPGYTDWVLVGIITGDGDVVTGSLIGGQYFGYVVSSEHTSSVVSLVIDFHIVGTPSTTDLDHSPADIVRWLLISEGEGTEPIANSDWPINSSSEPESPDNCITTYDTSGILNGRIQKTGSMVEHYGFQIRVRGTNHRDVWRKINDLKEIIDRGIRLTTINIESSIYLVHAITRSGGVLALGKESPTSQRLVFTLNAIVALKQLS